MQIQSRSLCLADTPWSLILRSNNPRPLGVPALDVDDRRSPSRGENHNAAEPASRAFWCVEDAASRMDLRLGRMPGDRDYHGDPGEDRLGRL